MPEQVARHGDWRAVLTWTVSFTLRRLECGSVQIKPASTSFSCISMWPTHQRKQNLEAHCRSTASAPMPVL